MMVSTGPPETFNNNASNGAATHLLCCADSEKQQQPEPKTARQAAASPAEDDLAAAADCGSPDDKKGDHEQAKASARQGSPGPQPPLPIRDCKYVDIYREKPIRVIVKVLVPVREHPKFNFVGKLLGPKGNSMKRLQEETMTKMAVLGRGSMRDKQKEEELRASMDPKYCHLGEELHVEITAYAPPAEAHARIAYALAEVRKYLIPDSNDEIRQEQMREMELLQNTLGGGDDSPGANGANSSSTSSPSPVTSPPVSSVGPMPGGRRMPMGMRGRGGGRGGGLPPPPILRGPMPGGRGGRGSLLPPPLTGGRGPHPLRKAPLPPPGANMLVRPSPKQKVMSILDRARVAMEESYQYEECYYNAYDPVGYGGYDDYDDNLGDYYEPADGYTDAAAGGHWKSFKAPPAGGAGADRTRFRTVPYARPK